jgi:hypothetical protein
VSRYPTGQPIRLSTMVKDLTGALVNPSTLTLTIQKSDGTSTAASPYTVTTTTGQGLFYQDVATADITTVDHYQYKWVATGTGAGVSYGAFDVFDPFTVTVLPLQDAKDMLNIPQSNTSYDAEIQVWVDTIHASLEKLTGGPIINRSITEFVKVGHGYRSLTLRLRPVVSITSITDNATGTALPVTDLDIDTNSGIVRRKLQLPFWARGPFYTVVYTAGWGVPTPPAFNGAARIILDHLWKTQHGPSMRPTLAGEDLTVDFGLGFSVPNRAIELVAPYIYEAYV